MESEKTPSSSFNGDTAESLEPYPANPVDLTKYIKRKTFDSITIYINQPKRNEKSTNKQKGKIITI